MTWAKLSDDFWCHPKIAGLSDRAFRLHVNAICWSAALETDGVIEPGILPSLRGTQAAVRELERAGLWERVDGGWAIHDFLRYNPSRSSLEERRSRRAQAGRMGAARRWQETPSDHGTSHSLSIGSDTSTAMATGMANAMANAIPDATAGAMPGAMTNDRDMSMHPYPIPIPYPECDSSSLRSSSSHSARASRAADDDDRSPPSSDDWLDAPDEPPEVREIRDLVLTALPRKYAADPLTFDEAAQLGRDFAGAHELVAEAIAECRRRRQLPFPRNLRGILQEARHDSPRDDPVLAQLRAIGALVE